MVVAGPPADFAPVEFVLPAGASVYRVFTNRPGRFANTFNPGIGRPTRFAFFGDPIVPVLYAAASEQAAVAETLLHDVPVTGGALRPEDYRAAVMSRLIAGRDLRLASFMGLGLRALGVKPSDLTDTDADRYDDTRPWAAAAHAAGFDGIVWMSRHCNSDQAYVFFGDRVATGDLAIDEDFARAFALPDDADWLTRMCAPLNIAIRR